MNCPKCNKQILTQLCVPMIFSYDSNNNIKYKIPKVSYEYKCPYCNNEITISEIEFLRAEGIDKLK